MWTKTARIGMARRDASVNGHPRPSRLPEGLDPESSKLEEGTELYYSAGMQDCSPPAPSAAKIEALQ